MILLMSLMTYFFIFPIATSLGILKIFGPLLYSLILLSIIFIIDKRNTKKAHSLLFLVLFSLVFVWLGYFLQRHLVSLVSFAFNILVFGFTTLSMITQILKSTKVDIKVIIEAINGYLLIGFMFTLANFFLWTIDNNSFNIEIINHTDILYYSFISLLTIGYGDIYPLSEPAKLTSVFFGLVGQFYLTIIMALLIGKYLSFNNQIDNQ